MKFKLIFIIFNAIVLFSFLFISLLPILMLGWEYAAPFWEDSWYLLVLFLLILASLDSYFIVNWKLFSLLEKRDWDKIREYLEDQIFTRNKINEQKLHILMNTYVVKSDSLSIIRLADHLNDAHPRLRSRLQLSLGIGFMLEKDYEGLAGFFTTYIRDDRLVKNGWSDWHWAFGMLRGGDQEKAAERLRIILEKGKDEMVLVLALYLYSEILGRESGTEEKLVNSFGQKYSPAGWTQKINTKKEKLHILALSAVLQEAGEWLIKKYKSNMPVASASEKMDDVADR